MEILRRLVAPLHNILDYAYILIYKLQKQYPAANVK